MATWKQVCNLTYTVRCVQRFLCHTGSPQPRPGCGAALEGVIQTVRPGVCRGLEPSAGAGWTAEQYAAVLEKLAVEPHAVLASELEAEFGGGYVGDQVLQAMVRQDLVAYRPYSRWARDIAKEAFGADLEEVVTAPTPAHLYCMQELRAELSADMHAADKVRSNQVHA